MNILELCETVSGVEKGMHINDIAQKIMILDSSLGESLEVVVKKVGTALNNNSKKKTAIFSKVPNGKGGNKLGFYKLKKKTLPKRLEPVAPDTNTQYTGKAGEYAVFSELLFWNFNPAMVTVDDGVDIIASRKGKYFHIQVKTAKEILGKAYNFSIKKNSFERYNDSQTYYIFVLRQKDKIRNFNDFVIVSNSEMLKLKSLDVLNSNNDSYSFSIQKIGGIYKLNKTESVIVNDFSIIQ